MDWRQSSARDAGTDVSESSTDLRQETKLAIPLHLQRLEQALRVDLLMKQVQSYVGSDVDEKADEMLVPINKQQQRAIKTKAYNLSKVKKSKKWIKNVLIEKSSDSEDGTDDDCEEMVRDLIKFQNFKRKVRKEFADTSSSCCSPSPALKPYKCYSTSLLSSALSPSFVEEKPVSAAKQAAESKAKKSRPSKASAKRKASAVAPQPAAACPATQVTALPSSPAPMQRSETGSIADSVSASTVSTPSLSSSLPASLNHSVTDSVDSIRKFNLEKMLDQIPYDMTLPDEILQSESSDAVLSPSTALTDEIVYSSQLPDEIFDTEESSNSLLSQTLSSPPSVVPPLAASLSGHKAATAPPTPTGLSGSVASSKSGPKNAIKWKAIRRANQPPLTALSTSISAPSSQSSSQNSEVLISARRKRVWATVVKCIPKTQEQVVNDKQTGIANCRKISGWCREEHSSILKKWAGLLAADPANQVRKQMLDFWEVPAPPADDEIRLPDDPVTMVESMDEIFANESSISSNL